MNEDRLSVVVETADGVLVRWGEEEDAEDDAGVLEHAEMVGEEVASQADVCGQLAR